jgi:hypothetical protein
MLGRRRVMLFMGQKDMRLEKEIAKNVCPDYFLYLPKDYN